MQIDLFNVPEQNSGQAQDDRMVRSRVVVPTCRPLDAHEGSDVPIGVVVVVGHEFLSIHSGTKFGCWFAAGGPFGSGSP